MSDKLVVVRRYGDEMSARIAAMSLEANGVPAQVSADTAGGALPSMALVFPVRLIVRAEDEALARELLDTPADEPNEEGD
jgi:putative signal transducing protein